MTSKEKIEYVWKKVIERARISPAGFFYVNCVPVVDIVANNGIPDDAPIIITCEEQFTIIKKFENDGLLVFVDYDTDKKGIWAVLSDPEIKDQERSPYISSATGTQIEPRQKVVTDLGKGILCVEGKPIEVSTKVGTESNQIRLLKTLMKEPERAWYRDEILEDWEGRELNKSDLEKISRTRLYQTAQVLNDKILRQAGVGDFMLYDTNKFQINPKYIGKT